MTIDDLCNPDKNAHFGEMLRDINFNYAKARTIDFTNPKTKIVSGRTLFTSNDNLILILYPDLGTSVMEHKREVGEKVHYVGSIVGETDSPKLLYKFQDDSSVARSEASDKVREYSPGQEFVTIASGINGLWHGYHNPDKNNPIVLRIRKTFDSGHSI